MEARMDAYDRTLAEAIAGQAQRMRRPQQQDAHDDGIAARAAERNDATCRAEAYTTQGEHAVLTEQEVGFQKAEQSQMHAAVAVRTAEEAEAATIRWTLPLHEEEARFSFIKQRIAAHAKRARHA